MSYAFVQARNYYRGRRAPLRWIVLHDMEAPESALTAESVAGYFRTTTVQASAHYNVDSNSIVQCVRDEDTAFHAPGVNAGGLGIEHAGYARQTRAEWLDPYSRATLSLSARLVAEKCRANAIPVAFVDAAGLRGGRPGITTHWEASKAFTPGGHTDPGTGFPLDWYLGLVRDASRSGITPAQFFDRPEDDVQENDIAKIVMLTIDGLKKQDLKDTPFLNSTIAGVTPFVSAAVVGELERRGVIAKAR